MSAALFVRCPICRELFPVPAGVIAVDGHLVITRLDRSDVHGHMSTCAAQAPIPGKEVEPMAGNQISRACTMCGTPGKSCMDGLKRTRQACCGICGDGNTHPEPGESVGSCQEFAVEQMGFVRRVDR